MFRGRLRLRFVVPLSVVSILLFTFAVPALAYFVPTIGQSATLVIGQTNFTSSGPAATQTGLNGPQGVAVDPLSHKVFVSDYYNNRVLRYASLTALTNGAAAEGVLGQPNFTSNTPHATQNGMDWPDGIFVDSAGRLWVADWSNNRVLRFDNAASLANGANANAVLGQPNFTSNTSHTTQNGMWSPSNVFFDNGGHLWVVDYQNSRVLRFDNALAKANGANADGVLGQVNFTTSAMGTTRSRTCYPAGLFVDSAGRLWVADQYNLRVLRFDNAAAKPNGGNADGVLGQPNYTSLASNTTQNGMSYPSAVTVDNASGRLYVADYANNRILVFNAAATLPNNANASFVLGQSNFTTGTANTGGISAATLSSPFSLYFDPASRSLLATDAVNNRVLVYGNPSRYVSVRSSAAQDGWTLESSENSNMGGTKNAAGSLVVGDNAANKQYRSLISFDTSTLPDTAVIHSVALLIKKAGSVGTDPLAGFGGLLVDVRNGSFGVAGLQINDFQAHASASAVGQFTAVAGMPGWYEVMLPAADFGFVNLTGLTQFRLRFSMDDNNNHVADNDSFFSGNAASATDQPTLKIEYSLP